MVKGFSATQIALHWGVAVLVLYQLLMGDDMGRLWWAAKNGGSVSMTTGGAVHIILGVAILGLVIWRIVLRLSRGAPEAPPDDGPALRIAAAVAHGMLYLLLILMPLSGLLAWFGGISFLGGLHGGVMKVLLWLFILVHVAAALYHHFVLKDGLLNRMFRPG